MFKLRRLYVDTIGVPGNRFVDLRVEATDLAGDPCDTIVWLRNGAGKTTMLSLLLALILPARRDFLASRTKKRTLEDLVGGQDTSHVIVEWVDPRGQRFLTGAVYQWEGRLKPREHNGEGKSRLKRSWWCLHPDESVEGATFDSLPTTSRTAGAVDQDRFLAHITNLAARGVNATVTEKINEWHEALRQRRFDPDLFRYFAEVNASEGGIDGLFTGIDSAAAFVRYLLRFVADERRVVPVRDLLGETAAEIAKRPTYEAERDFCTEARPLVEALGEAHARSGETARRRDEARRAAAGFKRALLDASESAATQASLIAERRETIEEQRLETHRHAEAAKRRRDEYRRWAAVFRLEAAKGEAARAKQAAADARIEADAWTIIPDLAAVAEARAALEAHRSAQRAAADEAAPVLAALEEAQSRLAGALEHQLAEVAAQLEAMSETESQAEAVKAAAESAWRQAVQEQAGLNAQSGEQNRIVERAEATLRNLLDAAILKPGERLGSAVVRLENEAAQGDSTITRVRSQIDRIADERRTIRAGLPRSRESLAAAEKRRDDLVKEAQRLAAGAAALRAEARLRELAQADDVDPLAEADDLLHTLANAVAGLDAAALDLRVEGAEDARAIVGLESVGLLPPRPAVATVVEALQAANVGAQPGWRYLAEHHAADATAVIAAVPEIADGVVVYSDPRAAAEAIAGVTTSEPVVIARAASITEPHREHVVIGPSPARYDRAAAADELAVRRQRAAGQQTRLETIAAARARDETLAARLRQLSEQIPADGMSGLTARVEAATAAVPPLALELETLITRESELDTELAARTGLLSELEKQQSRLEVAIARVDAALEEDRRVVAPARAWLESLPHRLRVVAEAEQGAKETIEKQEALLKHCFRSRERLEVRRGEWRTEREALGVAIPNTQSPEACRVAVAVAEAVLRERFPEAELRRNVEQAQQHLTEVTKRYQSHSEKARTRAEEISATDPAAQDPRLRANAIQVSRDAAEQAQQEQGVSRGEVKAAEAEVKEHTPPDRARHAQDLPSEPADREEALRLAAQGTEEAAALQAEAGDLTRERDEAGAAATRWRNRVGLLKDQADKLAGVEPAERAAGSVDHDDQRVRQDVLALAGRFDAAESAHGTAISARSQRAEALRTWAHQDRFGRSAEDEHGMAVRQLRDMFRADNLIERVAPHARDLAADLAIREQRIAQQIAQVEVHRQNVVARLTDLVGDALTDLTRASTLSELPERVGPWAGQQFLSVAARSRPTPEQVQVRVGELVDRMVSTGKIDLDPVELLWRATEAAVVEGFRATILKPAPDQPPGRTSVEEMHKWSGGENLTASLVLFCVLAKLRAENRTGAKAGAVGGVVPLDNPLGKANFLPFLELQRRVAAANGVQLVFWTGIGDLTAVGAFPRIAAMRKKPAAGRPGTAYVVTDLDASATADDSQQIVEHLSSVRADRWT